MKEIFRIQMDSFHGYAYTVYLAGEDFTPMKYDQFFILSKDDGDDRDVLIVKSISDEVYFEWNTNGWFQQLTADDLPDSL